MYVCVPACALYHDTLITHYKSLHVEKNYCILQYVDNMRTLAYSFNSDTNNNSDIIHMQIKNQLIQYDIITILLPLHLHINFIQCK